MLVKAINLKEGDKLSANGSTIVKAPILANPAGIRSLGYYKTTDVILTVKYANGKESVRVWNKNTKIQIEDREQQTPDLDAQEDEDWNKLIKAGIMKPL